MSDNDIQKAVMIGVTHALAAQRTARVIESISGTIAWVIVLGIGALLFKCCT